jgi:ATP-dependent DNA ligase
VPEDRARPLARSRRAEATALPAWIKPQLTKLIDEPSEGPEWLHEIKFDGYRMHARLDHGAVQLLTRTGPPTRMGFSSQEDQIVISSCFRSKV